MFQIGRKTVKIILWHINLENSVLRKESKPKSLDGKRQQYIDKGTYEEIAKTKTGFQERVNSGTQR